MPQEVQQKSLPSQHNIANSVMIDKESKLYNFMRTPDTQSTANSTITNISTHQQIFLNMVKSMNQLQVQRYLNTYDQNVNVKKLSPGEQSKRSVKRINYSTNTNENEGNYLLMVDAIQALLAMDLLCNYKHIEILLKRFYRQYRS